MEWVVAWIIKAAFFPWSHFGMPILNPESVTAIATCILAGGIVFAILQVRQARKSTNAQIAVELFRELRSEDTKNALRLIYELKNDELQSLQSYYRNTIDRLLDKFELLGLLVEQGIINEQLAIEAYAGPPALRCWYKLAPYIYEQRKRRGFFLKNYEQFTLRTCNYLKTKKIKVSFSRENGEFEKEDLAIWLTSPDFEYSPGSLDKKIKEKREEQARQAK